MQLFFSASLFSARELLDWGLINEVVPAPQLLTRAKEIASQFSQQSPDVLAHIKSLARAAFNANAYDGYPAGLRPSPSTLAAETLPRVWRHFATNANRNTEEQEPSASALVVGASAEGAVARTL